MLPVSELKFRMTFEIEVDGKTFGAGGKQGYAMLPPAEHLHEVDRKEYAEDNFHVPYQRFREVMSSKIEEEFRKALAHYIQTNFPENDSAEHRSRGLRGDAPATGRPADDAGGPPVDVGQQVRKG